MAQDNPNYPISTAVVSWVDSGGQDHIRVYSCDAYTVIERCYDGAGWQIGDFKQAGSAVSATSWNDSAGVHLRVYCTFQDKTVEWCNDPGSGWTQGDYTTV
ncbi:fucose-binding lectin protein [Sphingosinicella terrae]|uniref:fucose-binding lectin protein n=1 Tax=Sphingosinicella terrae TaxID=2172047 RepID=UPI000E0D1FD0|nr:fucose-binding lectin protein [Sphingosinicella terrae]